MIINKIHDAFNGWSYGLSLVEFECERSWLTDKLNWKRTDKRYASAFPIFKDAEGNIYEDPSAEDLDDEDVEECGWFGWGYEAEEPVVLKDKNEAIKFLVNEGKRLKLW